VKETQVDINQVIAKLSEQIASLSLQLAMRDTVIEKLQGELDAAEQISKLADERSVESDVSEKKSNQTTGNDAEASNGEHGKNFATGLPERR
jgi:hypothetical protein